MANWYPEKRLSHALLKKTVASLPDFETPRSARERSKKNTRVLRRHGAESQMEVAAIHESCSGKSPCKSWSCEYSLGLGRLWFVPAAIGLVAPYESLGICKVTLIPPDAVAPGELHTFDMAAFNQRMRRKIRAATDGLIVVGGIDFSANEHAGKKWAPHWKPHLDFLVGGADADDLTARLGAVNRGTGEGMHHLVQVEPVTYLPGALTYCLKSRFFRRITIDPSPEYIQDDKKPYANTIKRDLKSHQIAELLPVLHKASFDDRVILCRARRQGDFLVNLMGGGTM